MTREKAIQKIIIDLRLSTEFDYFIRQTMNRLGCGQVLDLDTVTAVEQVIRNDFRQS